MHNIWLLMLVALAVQAPARRTTQADQHVQSQAEEEEEARVEQDQLEKVGAPEDGYWFTNAGEWSYVAPGFVTRPDSTQVFRVKEDDSSGQKDLEGKHNASKVFTADLEKCGSEQLVPPARVLRVTNYKWTTRQMALATFQKEEGVGFYKYSLFKPSTFSHNSWRVTKADEEEYVFDEVSGTIVTRMKKNQEEILFTMERLSGGIFQIYVGHRGDKSTLIYYGAPHGQGQSLDYRFYHSKAAWEANKDGWVAKVDHQTRFDRDKGDTYVVTVNSDEDAGLILIANVLLDKTGDAHMDYHSSDRYANMGNNDG